MYSRYPGCSIYNENNKIAFILKILCLCVSVFDTIFIITKTGKPLCKVAPLFFVRIAIKILFFVNEAPQGYQST